MNVRNFCTWMLVSATQLALAGCPNGRSRQAEALPDPPLTALADASSAAAAAASAPVHPNDVDGGAGEVHMTLTLADGEAIKVALVEQLQKQNDLEDRDYLVTATRHARPSIMDNVMRVGGWMLQLDGDKLEVSFRMPGGRLASATYSAIVQRDGNGWRVGEVQSGQIRWR